MHGGRPFLVRRIAPGEIVTVFGSSWVTRRRCIPVGGQARSISLARTQVLVNGQPVPGLFSSYWRVNAILPTFVDLVYQANDSGGEQWRRDNKLSSSFVQDSGIAVRRTQPH